MRELPIYHYFLGTKIPRMALPDIPSYRIEGGNWAALRNPESSMAAALTIVQSAVFAEVLASYAVSVLFVDE